MGVPKKIWEVSKKKVVKKIWGNMARKGDFRHISEIYGLEQSFLGLKSLKNKFFVLIFYFLGLKSLKNKV